MALGFNNQPVNWQNDYSGYYDAAASMRQMGSTIAGAITEYAQKREEKKKNEQAVEMLRAYGKQIGMSEELLNDEKALKAGVESVGADGVLQMGMMAGKMKAQQDEMLRMQEFQRQQDEARMAALDHYDKLVKAGKSPAEAGMEGIKHYAERGGQEVKEMADLFGKAGDRKLAEAKDARDAEGAKLDAAYKGQMMDESKARVKQMGAGDEATPLGQAKPIDGLPGMVGVRTGKNSIQIVDSNKGAMQQDEQMRALLPVINKQLEDYLKKTRDDEGNIKKTWLGMGSEKKLNPFFESILAQLGYPGAQPAQQPGAQPPAPVPTQPQAQQDLPSELQGLF